MTQLFLRGDKWLPLHLAQEYDKKMSEEVPEEEPEEELTEEEKKKKSRTDAAIVTAGGDLNEIKAYEKMSTDELKTECDRLKIDYHHASGTKTLLRLLTNK